MRPPRRDSAQEKHTRQQGEKPESREDNATMEVGRTNELTVLTPSEVHWVEQRIGPLDVMARKMLSQGRRRTTACSHTNADGTVCGKSATHYTVDSGSGKFTGYCLDHWRSDGDPSNTLQLDTTEDQATAGAAK